MIFESEYRRQALEKWEQSREETIAEVQQDWGTFQEHLINIKKRLIDTAAMLIQTNKKHT